MSKIHDDALECIVKLEYLLSQMKLTSIEAGNLCRIEPVALNRVYLPLLRASAESVKQHDLYERMILSEQQKD